MKSLYLTFTESVEDREYVVIILDLSAKCN